MARPPELAIPIAETYCVVNAGVTIAGSAAAKQSVMIVFADAMRVMPAAALPMTSVSSM